MGVADSNIQVHCLKRALEELSSLAINFIVY